MNDDRVHDPTFARLAIFSNGEDATEGGISVMPLFPSEGQTPVTIPDLDDGAKMEVADDNDIEATDDKDIEPNDGDSEPSDDKDIEQEDGEKILNVLISDLLDENCVTHVRGFVWKDKIVLAALTKPFYQKSTRDQTRAMLQDNLAALAPNFELVLRFDVDLFRHISDDMTDAQKEELYFEALDRK